MKTVIIYFSLLITVSTIQAQSDVSATKYEMGMQNAFRMWGEDRPWEAANVFERIANAEPDQWLPPFYVAMINVVYSFGEKDKGKLTAQLKKAQDFINNATAISKDNPEILALQAQLYTAWIVFDGRQYGMKYSPKATELYERALALDPDNPRLIMANADWNIGSAKYFDQPIDGYCKQIHRAIELSETFEPTEKFYPKFNKERANRVLAENCK